MKADIELIRIYENGTEDTLPWAEWPDDLPLPRKGDVVHTMQTVPCLRWVHEVVWFPFGLPGDEEPRVRIYLKDTE